MRIGVFGPVFLNVSIDIEGSFDPFGKNTGLSSTNYSSRCLSLATPLASDNDVVFFSTLDTGAEPYILRMVASEGINTDYIATQPQGLGFKVVFNGSEKVTLTSCPSLSAAVDRMKLNPEVIDSLDAMIIDDLNRDVIDLCKEHHVKVFWLGDENYIEGVGQDDIDADLIKDLTVVSETNCLDILKEVIKS